MVVLLAACGGEVGAPADARARPDAMLSCNGLYSRWSSLTQDMAEGCAVDDDCEVIPAGDHSGDSCFAPCAIAVVRGSYAGSEAERMEAELVARSCPSSVCECLGASWARCRSGTCTVEFDWCLGYPDAGASTPAASSAARWPCRGPA